MKENNYGHIPVLLEEVIRYLDPQPGKGYVDATLGGGGYSRAIIEKIQPGGRLLAIDLDIDAIENAKYQISNIKIRPKPSVTLIHGNFKDIDKIVTGHNFENIDGIVADIGFSSYQLDQSERGISFQKRELLDMRFDRSSQPDAKFILQNAEVGELTRIFREYGEEKFSHQIAKKIVGIRNKKPVKYTNELFEVIQQALPKPVKHKVADSARRVFQALRIAVNHELENLEEFLPKAFDLLAPGGKLAVVSFHSLEDRIVKQYFVSLTKGCVCPPEFPYCICGKNPQARLLTKKPVTAGGEELERNVRSKSALLRAIVKL